MIFANGNFNEFDILTTDEVPYYTKLKYRYKEHFYRLNADLYINKDLTIPKWSHIRVLDIYSLKNGNIGLKMDILNPNKKSAVAERIYVEFGRECYYINDKVELPFFESTDATISADNYFNESQKLNTSNYKDVIKKNLYKTTVPAFIIGILLAIPFGLMRGLTIPITTLMCTAMFLYFDYCSKTSGELFHRKIGRLLTALDNGETEFNYEQELILMKEMETIVLGKSIEKEKKSSKKKEQPKIKEEPKETIKQEDAFSIYDTAYKNYGVTIEEYPFPNSNICLELTRSIK